MVAACAQSWGTVVPDMRVTGFAAVQLGTNNVGITLSAGCKTISRSMGVDLAVICDVSHFICYSSVLRNDRAPPMSEMAEKVSLP